MKQQYLIFLLFCWLPSSHANEDIADLLKAVDQMSAKFEQTVYDDTGRLLESSSGRFQLAAPHFMRWVYELPFEQQIIADGEKVWLYDVELEQVTVKPQDAATDQSPLYVLTNPETLDQRFELQAMAPDADRQTILLTPKSDQADFERIALSFVARNLSELMISDAFGQRTLISFTEVDKTTEVAPDVFRFTPPEGVDVVAADDILGEFELN